MLGGLTPGYDYISGQNSRTVKIYIVSEVTGGYLVQSGSIFLSVDHSEFIIISIKTLYDYSAVICRIPYIGAFHRHPIDTHV